MTRFDISFNRTIGHEGGYTNDSRDRGNWTTGVIGKGILKGTKYGISAMSYPNVDIKNLTLNEAKAIYRKDFWERNKCDELPAGLDYLVFDAAVNHGSSRAIRFVQAAAGSAVDGSIGPKTIAAVKAKDPTKLVNEFCVTRGLFYTSISTFQTYKLGWFRRLFDTHALALQDATNGQVAPEAPTPTETVCACPDTAENEEELAFWVQLSKSLIEATERLARH